VILLPNPAISPTGWNGRNKDTLCLLWKNEVKHTERYNMIYEEWRRFINGDELSDNHVIPSFILESWHRCKSKNVNPFLKRVPFHIDERKVQELLQKNDEIISISRPFLNNLYKFVSGSGFVAALYDNQGYMLHVLGDFDIVEKARRGNLLVGSCWSEEVAGTNGAGTTLIVGKPIQIYACEHYCINSHNWTCSSAPIHNQDKEIIGAILVSGPYQKANSHTLGMVVASVIAIENEIRLKKVLSNYGTRSKISHRPQFMCAEPKFFLCRQCGNLIIQENSLEEIANDGTQISCCGRIMSPLAENIADTSGEQHTPKYTIKGGYAHNAIEVIIGRNTHHDMSKEHHIKWIYLYTFQGGQLKYLSSTNEPKATFAMADEDAFVYCDRPICKMGQDHCMFQCKRSLAIYAYCNLHGLWKTRM